MISYEENKKSEIQTSLLDGKNTQEKKEDIKTPSLSVDMNDQLHQNKPKKNKKDRKKETYNPPSNERQHKLLQNMDKDVPLKLLGKKLLEAADYVTFLEANIYRPSYFAGYKQEQVTDIDVLGIKFDLDLTPTVVAIECKSGEDHALEELLKLKGIMDYVGASKGYLLKNRIANNAREMGYVLKICTLDQLEIIDLLSKDVMIGQNIPDWLKNETSNYLKERVMQEQANAVFVQAMKYLTRDFWNNADHRNIQNLCFLLNKMQKTDISSKKESKYLFINLTLYLSLPLIKSCNYALSKYLTKSKECLLECYFGGPKEKRDREVLFDRVNQILVAEGKPSTDLIPDYFNILVEVALLFLKSPSAAKSVPSCLSFYIKSAILDFEGYDFKEINNLYSDITLKLTKDLISATCKISGQNRSSFKDLFEM